MSGSGQHCCCVAGDRILTPWLTVLGRGLDGMPLVEVQLRRAGDELKGVRARVREGGGDNAWLAVSDGQAALGDMHGLRGLCQVFWGGGRARRTRQS